MVSLALACSSEVEILDDKVGAVESIVRDIDDRVSWITEHRGNYIPMGEFYQDYYIDNNLVYRKRNIEYYDEIEGSVFYELYYDENRHSTFAEITQYRHPYYYIYFNNDTAIRLISGERTNKFTNSNFFENAKTGQDDISQLMDNNPIDKYFLMMAEKIVPTSTMDMVKFEVLVSEAWKAEMMNCYEIIKNRTSDENIKLLLDNERDSYVEYIKNKAEIDIYYDASDAFYEGDGSTTLGTISRVIRVGIWSESYKQKTLELFGRMKDMDIFPAFIFGESEYHEKLKEAFFESHQKAFE